MTIDRPLLFLIGYRGTGKSAVAPVLAERLGWGWLDADAELEAQDGRSIRALFTEEGEPAFRDKESTLLLSLCRLRDHVIATGGGVILRQSNRELLQTHGTVVWLTADADAIWQRIQADPSSGARRPDLNVGGKAEVEEVLRQREPLYRACSDFAVSTTKKTVLQIVDEVVTLLGEEIARSRARETNRGTGSAQP
jgi:shikimate kinase